MSNAVALQIGPLAVHWYGIAWAVAVLWLRYAPIFFNCISDGLKDIWYDYIDLGLITIILGGRLGWVMFYRPDLLAYPMKAIAIWNGGLSFHGALIAGILYTIQFARNHKIDPYQIMDNLALWITPCLGIVRIANYVNGELWGRPTNQAWGVVFPRVDSLLRHPSQLYEAFSEGLLLGCIIWFCYSKLKLKPGQLACVSMFAYGGIRLLIEINFRAPKYFSF